MKGSALLSFASTLVFSLLGIVSAFESQPLGKRGFSDRVTFDDLGVNTRGLQCGNRIFNKREAYAVAREAMHLKIIDRKYEAKCKAIFCDSFPNEFVNKNIGFRVPGPYISFPIMANGNFYKGGIPGRHRLILDHQGSVAGIIYFGIAGWQKCLYNDQEIPRQDFFGRVKDQYHQYWKGMFPGKDNKGQKMA